MILVASDVHYEKSFHHRIDESAAFDWLLRFIRKFEPSNVIGLGDWGSAWNESDWKTLTRIVPVHTIYGNHDNLQTMNSATNRDGTKVLAGDGEVREIEGLRFGFINGIVSETRSEKGGIPRKTVDEYISMVPKFARSIDVLCTHESPIDCDKSDNRFFASPGTKAVRTAIEISDACLALSGHLAGPYALLEIGTVKSLRFDSSQSEKHFALLEPDSKSIRVQVWKEHKVIHSLIVSKK